MLFVWPSSLLSKVEASPALRSGDSPWNQTRQGIFNLKGRAILTAGSSKIVQNARDCWVFYLCPPFTPRLMPGHQIDMVTTSEPEIEPGVPWCALTCSGEPWCALVATA